MKNDNTIFWIIGIAIFVFLILPNIQQKQDDGFVELNVHYYDANKNEVFPEKSLFSIVTPPGITTDFIRISISGTASGISRSNIKIVSASPSALFNSLPTTMQSLTAGETRILWTSDYIATSQFESMTQPVRFWANISAKNDYTGLTEYSEGFVDLKIETTLAGSGSAGNLIFTSATKSYGNLVLGTDYQVSGNILSLKVDNVYNFTNFTLGFGMELRPWNPVGGGVAMYLRATDTLRIDGIVRSSMNYAYNPIRGGFSKSLILPDSSTIYSPDTANGGYGGNSGFVIGGGGVSGGSSYQGFGGGGAGGPVCGVYCFNYGGYGGTGGSPVTGGPGAYVVTLSSGTNGANGGSGGNSGGGGAAAQIGSHSGCSSSATGGNGASSYGANGISGSYYNNYCSSSQSISAAGGGGAGGYAGYSGIHFYVYANKIIFTGTIDTSGTSGGPGGAGGNGAVLYLPTANAGGGGGGGGGAGGNAGNIIFKYHTSISDTGVKIMNGGGGGAGGSGGQSRGGSVYNTPGSPGISGQNGNAATYSGGTFCIACWFSDIFG